MRVNYVFPFRMGDSRIVEVLQTFLGRDVLRRDVKRSEQSDLLVARQFVQRNLHMPAQLSGCYIPAIVDISLKNIASDGDVSLDAANRFITFFSRPLFHFSGAFGSIGRFLRGSHLEDVDDEQSKSDKDGKFFPKWSAVLAPIGVVEIWWSWGRVRTETRISRDVLIFIGSAIFWTYGFAGILVWSGRSGI